MFAATKASGGLAVSQADVCKTQVGNAVVPVPYPNQAELQKANVPAQKVKIVDAAALNLSSKVTSSITGPGAGIIGGTISNVVNGVCTFVSGSAKVKIEGKPAVRLNDPTKQNSINCDGTVAAPSQTKVKIIS